MYEYSGVLLRVVDGDTLYCQADLGFKVFIKEKFRLSRIDCPEMNTVEGKTAKAFVEQFTNATVRIISRGQDKYGRWLAEVFVTVNGTERNLNDYLIETGHAKPY